VKQDLLNFKDKLDQQHEWPSMYMFKFIVPKAQEIQVIRLFPKNQVQSRASSAGNYISVTATVMMGSSNEVIEIYQKAYKIEGVIAL
jgi:uncharacterized protein